jgi:hypothetical protein
MGGDTISHVLPPHNLCGKFTTTTTTTTTAAATTITISCEALGVVPVL